MTVFRRLRDLDETYFGHLQYAVILGFMLIFSGLFFIAHGFLPAFNPPAPLNLESTYKRVRGVWSSVRQKLGKNTNPEEN